MIVVLWIFSWFFFMWFFRFLFVLAVAKAVNSKELQKAKAELEGLKENYVKLYEFYNKYKGVVKNGL